MRLARYLTAAGLPALGIVEGAGIADLTGRLDGLRDMTVLVEGWDRFRSVAESLRGKADLRLDEARLLAPVAQPGKIFGVGLNYADHVQETGMAKPEHQMWFSMAVTAVNGPYSPIERPIVSAALDYEAEMVVVIGRRCRHVSGKAALDAVFGYCVGNDVSVRDWQMRSGQFTLGKSFDTHAVFGPYITTPDDMASGGLDIRCLVNGELRQSSNTRHLIFDVAAQIEHLSQAMTLEPGDVIFTGTPGGVGAAMKPPKFLKAGDVVRVEIDGLGAVENRVIDEVAPPSDRAP